MTKLAKDMRTYARLSLMLAAIFVLAFLKRVAGSRVGMAADTYSDWMTENEVNNRRKQLIYNGSPATPETFPFGVIICSTLYPNEKGEEELCTAVCTGSIISPGVILTAAHCFNDYMDIYDIDNDYEGREDYRNTINSSYRIAFGMDKSGPIPMAESVPIKKVVVGEPFDFSLGSSKWDIALIFLETCNHDAEPIRMLQNPVEGGSTTTATIAEDLPSKVSILGWGNDEGFCVSPYRYEDNFDPMQQMEYEVEACDKLSYCQHYPDRCDTSLSLCMTQNNVASCTGDSGGPIFVKAPSTPANEDGSEIEDEMESGEAETGAAVVRSVDLAVAKSSKSQFVQVGILSGGEVIQTGVSQRAFVGRTANAGFKDQATGALLPAYNEWLRKHLATDTCLDDSPLSLDDLFVDYSSFNSDGTAN